MTEEQAKKYWHRNLSRVHTTNALRIERRIIDLQGLFIKVGQLISIDIGRIGVIQFYLWE